MNQKVLIIGGHGIGDCLLSLQCAQLVKKYGINPKVFISARKEVYEPLFYLFGNQFDMENIDESFSNNNNLIRDESLIQQLSSGYDEVYYVIPDLLFNNKYSFDYEKYGGFPQNIRSLKLLDNTRQYSNVIYLGLMTTTPGYMYHSPMRLAIAIAETLPNNTIYFPIIDKWANQSIQNIEEPLIKPNNLFIERNPNLCGSLCAMKTSCYFIGTDNGVSHIAYHMGVPRLVLDPQYNRLPWIARWREDYLESIPINTDVNTICNIVSVNIKIPQTTLIPRAYCINGESTDWDKALLMKQM